MTFGAHKLLHSEPFWTTYTNVDCLRYISTCGKKSYIGVIYVLGSKLLQWNFLPVAQYTKSCAQTDFWTFRNFWTQFCENCGAT